MVNTNITINFASSSYKFDIRLLKSKNMKIKVKTVKEVNDEDWKTQLVQKKKSIPADTELEATVFQNFYGWFLRVIYDKRYYDINPHYCKFLGF